jgi:hypothetical protein
MSRVRINTATVNNVTLQDSLHTEYSYDAVM